MDKGKEIHKILLECIGAEYGICRFEDISGRLIQCAAKRRLPPDARSVIVTIFPYFIEMKARNLSRYAVVPDYHIICGEMLKNTAERLRREMPDHRFEPFIDNSPINEVYAAALAGLGIIGDNGLLITPEYGSWVFIGEIVTDLELPKSGGKAGFCEHCGRCKASCPSASGIADKSECLSRVTQKKQALSETEHALILQSGCVWGCDICQECCPHNRNVRATDIAEFIEGVRPVYKSGDSHDGRAFSWRPSHIIERNLEIVESGKRKSNR